MQCIEEGSLRTRLVIMDDDPEIAEQIHKILASQYDVVVVTDHSRGVLTVAEEHAPQVALLDISMPGMSGFAVARLLLAAYPRIKIIFVTQHSTEDYIQAAWEAGANGYVLKRKVSDDLPLAIEQVLHGARFTSSALLIG